MLAKGDGRRAVFCALLWLYVVGAIATAQAEVPPPALISDVLLPGGLPGALVALGDRLAPDRATFVVELVERFYNTPKSPRQNQFAQLQALFARFAAAGRLHGTDAVPERLPLPVTSRWWADVVFRRSIPDDTLLVEILQDRQAAYLYWGLLALDVPTRTWIAGEPALIDRIVNGRAARFVVAAPALRVRDGRVQVPGGDRAIPAWERLAGARVTEPAAFLDKLLDADSGWSAHVFRSLGALRDDQIACALRLDGDTAGRADAIERLWRVFVRSGEGLDVDGRPFSRPWRDPALLLGDLDTDGGTLQFPFDQSFWTSVFEAHGDPSRLRTVHHEPRAPVDPVWLMEQVFDADIAGSRLRADQVVFAARTFASCTDRDEGDAAAAIAALGSYPAIVRALERLRVTDPAVYRVAIDRAAALDRIRDTAAKRRAVAQFQGAFALVARGAARGSIDEVRIPALVTSLARVETSEAGAYDGGVAAWIDEYLRPLVATAARPDDTARAARGDDDRSPVEHDLLRLLAGRAPVTVQAVEWEGTVYRVDLAAAEAARLESVRGEQPPAWLSSARQVLDLAGHVERGSGPPGALGDRAAEFTRIADDLGLRDAPAANAPRGRLANDVVRAFRQGGANGPAATQRLVASLRRLADEFTATGLVELAYAAALGSAGGTGVAAGDAASRHDFGIDRRDGDVAPVAWRLPVSSVPSRGPWHLEGALLALDVCLADRWMTRVSGAPLPIAPSIDKMDRRSLMEVVTLVDPARLTDATRDAVAGYIRAGRARLAAAAAGDIEAVRAVVPLGAVRAGLLPWVLSHDRERLPSWLSTTELAWLGLGATDAGSSLDAFGAPVRPRIGCLCLQFPARRAPDSFTGRLSSGILMGAVPDLNLRLAELLAELHMPAALLPAVLAAATPDVVDRAPFRYPDDLRALDERVRSLGVDDVEQYLALLTTGGPLVPAREALENAVGRGGLSVSGPGDPFGVFVGTHPPGFVFSFKSEAP